MSGKRSDRRAVRFARVLTCLCAVSTVVLILPARAPNSASAVGGACVLSNGDFEAPDAAAWQLQTYVPAGASATLAFDGGYNSAKSLRIDIVNGGANPWEVQLFHEAAAVVPGRRYVLSFIARASQGREASFMLQRPRPPFDTFYDVTVDVGTDWRRYSYTLDVPASSNETPDFRVNLGKVSGSVWLDDIALCEALSPTPTPRPADQSCMVRDGYFQIGRSAVRHLTTSGDARAAVNRVAAGGRAAARVTTSAPAGAGSPTRFSRSGLRVTANATYSFAMYAKASQKRDAVVTLTDENGAPLWQRVFTLADSAASDQTRQYFAVFTVFQSANNATLTIDLGAAPGEAIMGDIQMCNAPLSFYDSFDGAALGDRWKHCVAYLGDCAMKSSGFEVEWFNPANVRVSNGLMKMALTRQPNTLCVFCNSPSPTYVTREYAGVLIHTAESFVSRYGYFEARMKMPRSQGIWPAFWMMPTLTDDGRIQWPPEIDVVEHFSRDPLFTSHTVHYRISAGEQTQDGRIIAHPAPLADDFHTYAVNWTPDLIIWYVDGAEVHRNTTARVRQPMYMLLSTGSGGPAGMPVEPLNQADTEVDYVIVTRNNAAFGYDDGGTSLPTPPAPTVDPRLTLRTYLPVTRR